MNVSDDIKSLSLFLVKSTVDNTPISVTDMDVIRDTVINGIMRGIDDELLKFILTITFHCKVFEGTARHKLTGKLNTCNFRRWQCKRSKARVLATVVMLLQGIYTAMPHTYLLVGSNPMRFIAQYYKELSTATLTFLLWYFESKNVFGFHWNGKLSMDKLQINHPEEDFKIWLNTVLPNVIVYNPKGRAFTGIGTQSLFKRVS